MRKNLAKHAAKELPLAKRVLALCFALIFVCSCLLPAFANGTGAEFDTPDTEVAEEVSAEPETLDTDFAVSDEPAALDEDFAVADEPATMDDSYGISTQPIIMDGGFGVDSSFGVDADVSTQDEISQPIGGIETPIGGIETPIGGSTPIVVDDGETTKEGPSKITTDKDGNIVYEYDVSDVDFGDDFTISRPDGDYALDKVDAAYSIPTNIYHFWLKKMSSYDLADIARDAKAADMTVEQYLAMYGKEKGCFHIMTAADGANLKDYQFANPTSNDDPEGNSRTFAGWYYTDELGDEQKFVFDEFLYISEGTTVEVYAKWKEEAKPVSTTAEINALDVDVTVDGLAGVKNVQITPLSEDDENDFADSFADKVDAENKLIDLYSFDLTPLDKDEKTVQPDSGKKATVTLEGLDVTADDTVKVFHKTEYDTEDLTSTAKVDADGNLTFKTESFSPFAVVVERVVATGNGGEEDEPVESEISTTAISDSDLRAVTSVTLSVGDEMTFYSSTGNTAQSWSFKNDYSGTNTNVIVPKQYGVNGTGRNARSFVTVLATQAGTYNLTYNTYWGTDTVRVTVTSNDANPTIQFVNVYADVPPSTSQYGGIYVAYTYTGGDSQMKIRFEDEEGNLLTSGDHPFFGEQLYNFNSSSVDLKMSTFADSAPAGYSYVGAFFYWADHLSGNGKLVSYDDNTVTKVYVTRVWKVSGTAYQSHLWYTGEYVEAGGNRTGSIDATGWAYQANGVLHVVYMKSDKGASLTIQDHDGTVIDQTSDYLKDHYDGSYVDLSQVWIDAIAEPHSASVEAYKFKHWKIISGNNAGDKEYTTEELQALLKNTNEFKLTKDTVIKAVCEINTETVTITKQVTGLFGDREKEFTFKIAIDPENTDITATKNGTSISLDDPNAIKLRGGDSITISNVPVGTKITVTETDAENYDTSATEYDVRDDKTFAYTLVTENGKTVLQTDDGNFTTDLNVIVNNHREAIIDNGVLLDTLPYILILAVVVGGGALLFIRKRKHDDDE